MPGEARRALARRLAERVGPTAGTGKLVFMRRAVANIGHDYLFAKLHGLWAQSQGGDPLARLILGGQPEALARILQARGIETGNRATVQKELLRHLLEVLASIARLADESIAAYYQCFMDRYFFENLKAVLHYRCFPEQEVDIDFLVVDSPHLSPVSAARLLGATTIQQFHERLPQHKSVPRLLPLLLKLDETKDVFALDCDVDRLYYEYLCLAARSLPAGIRDAAEELVRMEIDVANLVMLLRNTQIYHMPTETLSRLWIPDGLLLPVPALAKLATASTSALAFGQLPTAYAKVLEPLREAQLYVSEYALADSLYRKAFRVFMDYGKPAASVVAFPFLKRSETLNLGRVFEGLRFGLAPADILSMVIGVRHA